MPRRTLALVGILTGFATAANIAPSNPASTPQVKKVLTYLQNLGGQGILSGQLSMLNEMVNDTSPRERYQMARNGNRMPAVYAANFGDWPMAYQDSIIRTIQHKWVKSNGQQVLMLCWHTVQPDSPEDSGYAAMSHFSADNPYPAWKIDSILKPGTTLNVEHMKRVKRAGMYLKQLDSSGIPVIWRPYHENNGAFFWWGQQARFKELWKQMYTYYSDSLKLNNLIWAYSMCYFGDGDRWIDSLYPGHKYVDLLGVDIYAGSFGQDYHPWIYQTLLSKAEGRPIAITENGTMPNVPVLKYTQPKWTFFCTWFKYEVDTMWVNDYYHPAGYSLQNSDALYKAVYGDPYTLTRDQIDFDLGPSSRVFLSTGVSPTGSGSIVSVPDSLGRYSKGQKVSVTATPAPGWVFTGWAGDATGRTNPLEVTLDADRSVRASFAALKGTNLLLNGKFSDSLVGWGFSAWQTNAKATASVEATDSSFHVVVTGTSADPWGTQLTQGLLLEQGTTYEVSFDVWGDANAKISYGLGESSGLYRKIWSGSDTLKAAILTVRDTIVDTLPTQTALRLEFNLGAQTGNLWLDNIKVARISGSDPIVGTVPRSMAMIPTTSFKSSKSGITWSLSTPLSSTTTLTISRLDGTTVRTEILPSGSVSGSVQFVERGTYLVRLGDAPTFRVLLLH
ncbi:MAG: hypothetical protein RL173_1689 [Fibrobacterota bacterium]|jgi:mannan endo-1,4-beta-mannosidase